MLKVSSNTTVENLVLCSSLQVIVENLDWHFPPKPHHHANNQPAQQTVLQRTSKMKCEIVKRFVTIEVMSATNLTE